MKTLLLTILLFCGVCLADNYAHAQVLTTDLEHDGFVGVWFPADENTGKTIIALGGSEGGNQFGNKMAPVLNDAGYNVLSVALFKMPGLPSQLELVPLEYVDRAHAWLMKLEEPMIERIAILGVSKGAEFALLHASRTDNWSAVIAIAPSSVVWQSINEQDYLSRKSSWSYVGEPLDFLPYDFTGGFTGIFNLYNNALNGMDENERSIIQAENISAPVFLASGGDDRLWPSERMSHMIINRINIQDDPAPVVHHHVPEAGHMILVADPESADRNSDDTFSFLGGSRELITQHTREVMDALLLFLENHF